MNIKKVNIKKEQGKMFLHLTIGFVLSVLISLYNIGFGIIAMIYIATSVIHDSLMLSVELKHQLEGGRKDE